MTEVPTTSEVFEKDLTEQRALFMQLSRSMQAMSERGIDPPEHWESVHRALSDHFIALSQGR